MTMTPLRLGVGGIRRSIMKNGALRVGIADGRLSGGFAADVHVICSVSSHRSAVDSFAPDLVFLSQSKRPATWGHSILFLIAPLKRPTSQAACNLDASYMHQRNITLIETRQSEGPIREDSIRRYQRLRRRELGLTAHVCCFSQGLMVKP